MKTSTVLIAIAGVAMTLTLVGCASATYSSSIGATPAPILSIPPAGFVLSAVSTVANWADANATLAPMDSLDQTLVSPDTAYKAVSAGILNVLDTTAPTGPPTATLYSYTNSAYGEIQPDGTVKLDYTNKPVWAFSIPLAKYVDMSQGPLGAKHPTIKRSGCFFYYIVDAATGVFMTSGEECTVVDTPLPPIPTPIK